MGFKERLYHFMAGRYGGDALNTAVTVLCFVLLITNVFVRSMLISVIVLILMICVMYRSMSRKIYDRQRENRLFLDKTAGIRGFFSLNYKRVRDRKTHIYRKCPSCGKILRLPRKKGVHTVCCPCCSKDFECRVRS